jgi:hypothetical protein
LPYYHETVCAAPEGGVGVRVGVGAVIVSDSGVVVVGGGGAPLPQAVKGNDTNIKVKPKIAVLSFIYSP